MRVTGPFTVESLSPHRSLAFAGRATEKVEQDASLSDASFEQMILDRLAKAGVQNGRRNERRAARADEQRPADGRAQEHR